MGHLKYFAASLALGITPLTMAPAFADARSESFVESNARDVLGTLSDPTLDQTDRRAKFREYMNEFADIDLVSGFVIGKYVRRFSDADMAAYREAFREYALAVYETELDRYRGQDIVIQGSTDSGKYSVVDTRIVQADGDELDVRWRLIKRDDGFKVVDVALDIDGSVIWLAIEQKAQFLAILDTANGDADALIERLNAMTAKLQTAAPEAIEPPQTMDRANAPQTRG